MKKQIIIGGFVALMSAVNAQPWLPATGGGSPVYNNPLSANVGIGTSTPAQKLVVKTAASNDGIEVVNSGNGGAALNLWNTATSGQRWGIYSFGSLNAQGAGNFGIYDYLNNADRFFIKGGTLGDAGNVGIGTIIPNAKLHVNLNVPAPGQGITYRGIKSNLQINGAIPPIGAHHAMIAVEAIATGFNGEGLSKGVYGESRDAWQNIGGDFLATGTAAAGCIYDQFGVRAIASAVNGNINYGIWAAAAGACSANWAGWFNGNTFSTGTYQGSDQKLKKNIKPLENSIEKIKKLNPSSYIFKVEEFEALNLPAGNQLGLIAQELEKVFPELIQNVPETKRIDLEGKDVKVPEFKSVNYTGLIPVLISGIKEQQQQIEAQSKENTALKSQMAELQKKVDEIASGRSGKTTGINQPDAAMEGFALDQNIPNPFSSETVINYTLPQQVKNASLMVYDLSGKQIASFPLEKTASSITLRSEKLSAGIYIYSVMADGKILDSKRMVVAEK